MSPSVVHRCSCVPCAVCVHVSRVPVALEECFAVYKRLLAGELGFRPASVCLVNPATTATAAAALLRSVDDFQNCFRFQILQNWTV